MVIKTTFAAISDDIDQNFREALSYLDQTNNLASEISKRTKAVLVFPNIIKVGLVFGSSYGEGVLIENNNFLDFYNSVGGSSGSQAGAQSYGYAVLPMTDKAVKYLDNFKS